MKNTLLVFTLLLVSTISFSQTNIAKCITPEIRFVNFKADQTEITDYVILPAAIRVLDHKLNIDEQASSILKTKIENLQKSTFNNATFSKAISSKKLKPLFTLTEAIGHKQKNINKYFPDNVASYNTQTYQIATVLTSVKYDSSYLFTIVLNAKTKEIVYYKTIYLNKCDIRNTEKALALTESLYSDLLNDFKTIN